MDIKRQRRTSEKTRQSEKTGEMNSMKGHKTQGPQGPALPKRRRGPWPIPLVGLVAQQRRDRLPATPTARLAPRALPRKVQLGLRLGLALLLGRPSARTANHGPRGGSTAPLCRRRGRRGPCKLASLPLMRPPTPGRLRGGPGRRRGCGCGPRHGKGGHVRRWRAGARVARGGSALAFPGGLLLRRLRLLLRLLLWLLGMWRLLVLPCFAGALVRVSLSLSLGL